MYRRTIIPIVLLVIATDQITKYIINYYIGIYDSVRIFPFLHIVNVRNTGAAFGMLKGIDSNFFIFISIIAIVFVIIMLKKKTYNSFGLSLLLGGAIGNLIDRLIYGYVIDFIDISFGRFHWPAFNVADSSLTIGIAIILITSILKKN
jgi:signal peptidase II